MKSCVIALIKCHRKAVNYLSFTEMAKTEFELEEFFVFYDRKVSISATVNNSLLITHDSTLKVLSTCVKYFQINYSAKTPTLLSSHFNCENDGWCVM
jgi:hypothetical protein